jgi:APA family basic amino acid/polyamine antiporter
MLGAGALVAFTPAVAEAGWWAFAGLALATVVASMTAVSFADLNADSGSVGAYRHVRGILGVMPGRLAGVLELAGRVVAITAVAGMVGRYVTPTGSTAAVIIVLAVCAARVSGIQVSTAATRALAIVAIVTFVVVVTVGVAIAPVGQAALTSSGVPGSNDATGILAAAGVLFFGFLGVDQAVGRGVRTSVLSVGIVSVGLLLIGFVAMRQLGGPRLALSPTPLRDTLAAADGAILDPLLTAGLLVGAVIAIYSLVGGAMSVIGDMADTGDLPAVAVVYRPVFVGAAAAGLALFVSPTSAVGPGACLMLGSYAFVNSAARSLCREQRSSWVRTGCCGLALSVIVAVNISVVALVVAVGVLIVGTLLCTLSARSADPA